MIFEGPSESGREQKLPRKRCALSPSLVSDKNHVFYAAKELGRHIQISQVPAVPKRLQTVSEVCALVLHPT